MSRNGDIGVTVGDSIPTCELSRLYKMRQVVQFVQYPPFAGTAGENTRIRIRGIVHLFDTAEVRRTSVEL